MQCFFISSAVQMQYLACWYKQHFTQCAGPENIHTPPTEGTGISWGVGGSVRPKNLKKCKKLCWNFQRGWGEGRVLEKIPSVGKVCIFYGTTQYIDLLIQ